MRRSDLETALEIFWREHPELGQVDFCIQQINNALEEAANQCESNVNRLTCGDGGLCHAVDANRIRDEIKIKD